MHLHILSTAYIIIWTDPSQKQTFIRCPVKKQCDIIIPDAGHWWVDCIYNVGLLVFRINDPLMYDSAAYQRQYVGVQWKERAKN